MLQEKLFQPKHQERDNLTTGTFSSNTHPLHPNTKGKKQAIFLWLQQSRVELPPTHLSVEAHACAPIPPLEGAGGMEQGASFPFLNRHHSNSPTWLSLLDEKRANHLTSGQRNCLLSQCWEPKRAGDLPSTAHFSCWDSISWLPFLTQQNHGYS